MPSDRRSEPLIRPYFLLSGNTPLSVISSLAGGPRYIHFRDSRIKKFQITISDWLKAEHSASYQEWELTFFFIFEKKFFFRWLGCAAQQKKTRKTILSLAQKKSVTKMAKILNTFCPYRRNYALFFTLSL
mgnify:CR=1 FL=1